MFEMWGERLGITADENDWACREGFAALRALDEDLERRGLEILQQLEEESRVGVLLPGRPYHLDPGLNHGVLDEFQTLGYPVLSIRSIPKAPQWLARFFKDDLERGFVHSPLDVSDVWPENYSANSVQKVWAAKFAARHPNIVVLDPGLDGSRARGLQAVHLGRVHATGESAPRVVAIASQARQGAREPSAAQAEGLDHRRVLGDDDGGRRQLPPAAFSRA
jgi:predicted nucleotide-binding protein (sugar kinase/HSP70/actin superfamily)